MSEKTYQGKNEQHYYNTEGKEISKAQYDKIEREMAKVRKMIKNIATKRIEKEKAIEAKTGKKTRLPKMNKLEKTVAIVKENLGLSK